MSDTQPAGTPAADDHALDATSLREWERQAAEQAKRGEWAAAYRDAADWANRHSDLAGRSFAHFLAHRADAIGRGDFTPWAWGTPEPSTPPAQPVHTPRAAAGAHPGILDGMPSLDDQMAEAFRRQRDHAAASHAVERTGWTRRQWVADAERLMNDLDGSVMDLVNGHVMALLAELAEVSGEAEQLGDLRAKLAAADTEVDELRRLASPAAGRVLEAVRAWLASISMTETAEEADLALAMVALDGYQSAEHVTNLRAVDAYDRPTTGDHDECRSVFEFGGGGAPAVCTLPARHAGAHHDHDRCTSWPSLRAGRRRAEPTQAERDEALREALREDAEMDALRRDEEEAESAPEPLRRIAEQVAAIVAVEPAPEPAGDGPGCPHHTDPRACVVAQDAEQYGTGEWDRATIQGLLDNLDGLDDEHRQPEDRCRSAAGDHLRALLADRDRLDVEVVEWNTEARRANLAGLADRERMLKAERQRDRQARDDRVVAAELAERGRAVDAARAELAEVRAAAERVRHQNIDRVTRYEDELDRLRAELATARRDAAADALEYVAPSVKDDTVRQQIYDRAAEVRSGERSIPGSPEPAPAGGEEEDRG